MHFPWVSRLIGANGEVRLVDRILILHWPGHFIVFSWPISIWNMSISQDLTCLFLNKQFSLSSNVNPVSPYWFHPRFIPWQMCTLFRNPDNTSEQHILLDWAISYWCPNIKRGYRGHLALQHHSRCQRLRWTTTAADKMWQVCVKRRCGCDGCDFTRSSATRLNAWGSPTWQYYGNILDNLDSSSDKFQYNMQHTDI